MGLLPKVDWAAGLRAHWQPDEPGARRALGLFLAHGLKSYTDERNRPDLEGASRLSPHLHSGPEFQRFPWRRDTRALKAWQRGRTGCPVVDAGMRQLWQTGWMRDRVRMIPETLQEAGVVIGETYPPPLVAHDTARDRALQAYSHMKDGVP